MLVQDRMSKDGFSQERAVETPSSPGHAPLHKDALALAWQYRLGGDLRRAEAIYRQTLQSAGNDFKSLFGLGTVCLELGNFAEAADAFQQTLLVNPSHAPTYLGLGQALAEQGRLEEAGVHLRKALAIRPNYTDAINGLGIVLAAQRKQRKAISCFRQVVRLRPGDTVAHANLGNALQQLGRVDDALASLQEALRLDPANAGASYNLGFVLQAQEKWQEAAAAFERAVRAGDAAALNERAKTLRRQGRLDEAESCLREAIRLCPDYAEAYHTLGVVLVKQERLTEAIANYREVIRLKPDHASAHRNLGLALLTAGNFAAGWKEYEWRWQTKRLPKREFTQPRWDGGSLAAKTILLHAEQGFGDTIQFIRYAALAEQWGGKVVVECQRAHVGLLAGCPGISQLVPHGEPLPDFEVQAALLSLPGICHTTLDTVPATVPYLTPRPDLVQHWRDELEALAGFKVGIAWQGSPAYQDDCFRSPRLAWLRPLSQIPGVRLVSLQKGPGTEQLEEAAGWGIVDFGERLDVHGAFLDSAAIIKHLDLVISSDTAVAHLAGALAAPVWVALCKGADWRWLLDREDSPWYPTMRLFRQERLGDWHEVFERMAQELASLV
jgi:tetratricopeptide (TPR) repeat protein